MEAWVEPLDDGEYRLVQTGEIFEQFQSTTLPDGTVLLKQESETDRNPFVESNSIESKGFVLAYDRVNFGLEDNRQSFLEEVRNSSCVDFEEAEFFRKSIIPDPEIIVRLSELLVQYLIAKKVLEKVGDKAIDLAIEELAKFYSLVRSAVIAAVKYAIPQNRPITYLFELPGKPFIQFIACSTDPDLVLSAVVQDKLENALTRANQLLDLVHAEKIQFLLNAEGDWEFNYLLTDTGGIVGTEKSFSRRTRRLQLLSPEHDDPGAEPD